MANREFRRPLKLRTSKPWECKSLRAYHFLDNPKKSQYYLFMDFDQWLVKYTKDLDGTPAIHGAMEDAWNACKEEALKILKKELSQDAYYDCIDKIEKL